MLDVATKMEIKRQGTDPSMPAVQMSGSAFGTFSLNRLDKKVPRQTPTMPETTVTAPKM